MTFTQRLILEVLQKEKISHTKLSRVLGIDLLTLRVLLEDFLVKGIVKQDTEGDYFLNKELSQELKQELLDQKSLHIETLDFLSDCLEDRLLNQKRESFNCKKISMSAQEYKMYQALLYNLQNFIEGVEKNTTKDKSNHQIVFWGERSYQETVRHALNY